jgi:hypothetical protein
MNRSFAMSQIEPRRATFRKPRRQNEADDLRERLLRPLRTREELADWVRLFLGLRVPAVSVCPHHDAPLEYLARAYFEPGLDQVVWAPRGGGKTRLAAAATLLDLLHKNPASVRILGGSLEQSMKLWDYLLPDVERLLGETIPTRGTARRLRLPGGADAAVLTQSQRAVRGLRVQKLRCDEVELFDPAIWEAAQLVTRSIERDGNTVRGAIEAISTYHAAGGLMGKIIDAAESRGAKVTRWCVLDVLARCEADRDCATCPLWDDCRGVAKTKCDGYVSVSDAVAMKARVSVETWQAEMLCLRPSTRGRVFPTFDEAVHVRESLPPRPGHFSGPDRLTLSLDFGFANPLVCLWIVSDGEQTFVLDEYVQEQRTLEEHLATIESRGHGKPRWASCDPAGAGRNDQTAASNVTLLRARGYVVKHRASRIVDGIERIRHALRPASGEPTLFVHPRCTRLRAALKAYRYGDLGGELPIKDGTHDHPIDALRYHFVNDIAEAATPRRY